jgi:hypothetical chaperone protein
METPTAFAIDFGTSNSLLAAVSRDRVLPPVALDPSASDPTVLRSALYFLDSPQRGIFGTAAIREFVANGFRGRLIRSIKRHLPSRSFTKTRIGDRYATLEQLIGSFIRSMRETACRALDADVRRVVLGRPARFSNDAESDQLAEDRLRRAAALAGFEEISFCPEPVAAAYDFVEDLESPRIVLVADLGGGTSDFTIVRMDARGFRPEDVLAVGGVSVAGDAIDGAMVRAVVAPQFGALAKYRALFGANILDMPKPLIELLCSPADLTLLDRESTLRSIGDIRAGLVDPNDRPKLDRFITVVEDGVGFTLYDAVEGAKRRLSEAGATEIELDYPSIELNVPATRPVLEDVGAKPIARMLTSLDDVLGHAGIAPEDVEILCLTGGTSRMPLVEASFREKLPNASLRRLKSFHSVVEGLARHAIRVG